MPFHTHIGPVFAAGLVRAALEGIPGALRIGGRRLGLAEQLAEVEECCCAAERSESWAFFHLAMNSCGSWSESSPASGASLSCQLGPNSRSMSRSIFASSSSSSTSFIALASWQLLQNRNERSSGSSRLSQVRQKPEERRALLTNHSFK